MSFERIDMYLKNVLSKYDNNYPYDIEREKIKSNLSSIIYDWFKGFNDGNNMKISIEQSGSIAKGTAIKGKSDIDLFVSLRDEQNLVSIEEFHKEMYKYLKCIFGHIREQNVSIGIVYNGYDIDVVPAKMINTDKIDKYQDHYLWQIKSHSKIQTNIREHINMVKNSNLKDIIMILKIWRECNNVEFPSVFIEQLCINELGMYCSSILSQKFYQMMSIIEDRIETIYLEDPSNSTNIISNTIEEIDKIKLKVLSINTINSDNLAQYIW